MGEGFLFSPTTFLLNGHEIQTIQDFNFVYEPTLEGENFINNLKDGVKIELEGEFSLNINKFIYTKIQRRIHGIILRTKSKRIRRKNIKRYLNYMVCKGS